MYIFVLTGEFENMHRNAAIHILNGCFARYVGSMISCWIGTHVKNTHVAKKVGFTCVTIFAQIQDDIFLWERSDKLATDSGTVNWIISQTDQTSISLVLFTWNMSTNGPVPRVLGNDCFVTEQAGLIVTVYTCIWKVLEMT